MGLHRNATQNDLEETNLAKISIKPSGLRELFNETKEFSVLSFHNL